MHRRLKGILRTFAHALHGADLSSIFHSMDSEVNLGHRLLLLNCTDGVVDLDVATPVERGSLIIGIHAGRLGGKRRHYYRGVGGER